MSGYMKGPLGKRFTCTVVVDVVIRVNDRVVSRGNEFLLCDSDVITWDDSRIFPSSKYGEWELRGPVSVDGTLQGVVVEFEEAA